MNEENGSPDLADLAERLFSIRDALTRLSLALSDLRCQLTLDEQQQALRGAEAILRKFR